MNYSFLTDGVGVVFSHVRGTTLLVDRAHCIKYNRTGQRDDVFRDVAVEDRHGRTRVIFVVTGNRSFILARVRLANSYRWDVTFDDVDVAGRFDVRT